MEIKRCSGQALSEYIPQLAELRIRVFREYPYLYDGDAEYEAEYLNTYTEASDSVIVLALDDNKVVGASTALPMRHETDEFRQPFIDAGFNIDEVFYCGESVLLPEYRGRGIGVAFFQHREAHALALGGFRYSCFCAVQRPDNHPRRPANYQPLDSFWQHRGYQRRPDLNTGYRWKDLDEEVESTKPMGFWIKELA